MRGCRVMSGRAASFARARRALVIVAAFGSAAAARGQTAEPDAVIEKWSQHWILREDSSVQYQEFKSVKLNNDRAYGEFADPRITFNRDTDKVEVLIARVRRPDGATLDVPKYSQNEVSLNDAA